MAKQKIEVMVEGGKATPAPPLGPTLGQLKMNVGEVINQINDKTQNFKGMKVPVTLIVDNKTKEFEIEVGTPPASQLIKKELGIEKGSGEPNKNKIFNAAIEQIIKVALMKKDSMFVKDLKGAVKCIAGSMNSMGILVEGKIAPEFNKDLDAGVYDKEIKEQKTEVSKEKKDKLKEQLEQVQEELRKELERLKAEEEAEKAAVVAPPEEEKKEEVEEEKKEEAEEGKEEEGKEKPKEEKKFKEEKKEDKHAKK